MAPAVILNFTKSGILGCSYPCMINIYQCAKFDKDVFIYDRDMAKKSRVRMAADFNKSVILGPIDPCMVNIYLRTKFWCKSV